MTSPRRDRWIVSAFKPKDIKAFDSIVMQPFAKSSRLRFDASESSEIVYELFNEEAEAISFAKRIEELGAFHVSISPPKAEI